ncbi:hypothetical protein Tco_0115877 [Tanacetum coccineum]
MGRIRIPLEGDEMLRVHSERTQGVVKTLINTKRQVDFRIDLVHGATPVAKSLYRLAPSEMQELQDKVDDALTKKGRMKPRRVRAVAMTIQYGVKGMILAVQSEAFKQENVLMVGSEMNEAHASREEKDNTTHVSNCRICLRGEGCNVKDFWLAATA